MAAREKSDPPDDYEEVERSGPIISEVVRSSLALAKITN
jgi:hypothetical protein